MHYITNGYKLWILCTCNVDTPNAYLR
jgi:hypothetical protein